MSATPSLLSLLLAGTLIRTGLWFVYEPISHPDSATYFTAAAHIANGDFTGYEGRRTPGYPALIALAGLSPSKVWVLQMLCGLAISTLLFYIGLSATGQPQFAALIGMTYNLNLAQLFFEANLLSETTSTLTIVGVVAALAAVHVFDRPVPPDVDDQADGHRAHDRLVTGDIRLPIAFAVCLLGAEQHLAVVRIAWTRCRGNPL